MVRLSDGTLRLMFVNHYCPDGTLHWEAWSVSVKMLVLTPHQPKTTSKKKSLYSSEWRHVEVLLHCICISLNLFDDSVVTWWTWTCSAQRGKYLAMPVEFINTVEIGHNPTSVTEQGFSIKIQRGPKRSKELLKQRFRTSWCLICIIIQCHTVHWSSTGYVSTSVCRQQ